MVKRYSLFKILQEKNIPNLLLQNVMEIHKNNEIKVKLNSKVTDTKQMNRGVRQGCPLSPTLFNICMNEIIIQWNKIYNKGIRIQNNTKLNTLLYADDQIIISNSEDNLQRGVYMLNNILKDFKMKISCSKSKTMAFLGQQPVRSKIVIENKIL
jgi:hypothetical protein